MDNAKITKAAKVIDRLLLVVQIVLIAAAVLCVIAVPLLTLGGDIDSITFGSLTLHLADASVLWADSMKALTVPELLLAVVMFGFGWYFVRILRSIFEPLKEGRPFEQGISGRIRKLAWVTLIGGGLLAVGKIVLGAAEIGLYDLSGLFDPAVVSGYSFRVSVDGGFLILTAVLFLLSYVFRCGEALQKESDETL